jgi:hypothetical protein
MAGITGLPFGVPFDDDAIELPPDSEPALPGFERVASFHVGGPDFVPPPGDAVPDADAVTVVTRQRYADGRLHPFMYELTFWRRASEAVDGD